MNTILVIDDDEKLLQVLKIRLKAAGHAVLTARDGVEGLRLALEQRPDLIILDMWMPVGTGASVAHRLKESAPEIPFIFLTASRDEQLRDTARKLGAVGFFEKPYDPSELLKRIDRILKPDAPSQETPPAAAPPQESRGAKKKLLIIEDDRKIAMALALRLKNAGYETAMAYDALTAVNTAVSMRPDLVLLDISMPAGNGFTVAERIQLLVPTPTPIIFLTASKQPDFRRRAEELGAAGYFEKPYDAEQLLAAIKHSLDP